jgi:antitoxin PrlF
MIATVTSKGQVTIPKAIREFMGIHPKDKIDFVLEENKVILRPVKTLKDLRGSVPSVDKPDLKKQRKFVRAAVSKRMIEEME